MATGANVRADTPDVGWPGAVVRQRRGAKGGAAASGTHARYGTMIEVDHGTGLVTRRGHGSQSNVRQGDVVARGQRLPLWAARTLDHAASHCEVRLNGVPQNPARYLQASG